MENFPPEADPHKHLLLRGLDNYCGRIVDSQKRIVRLSFFWLTQAFLRIPQFLKVLFLRWRVRVAADNFFRTKPQCVG